MTSGTALLTFTAAALSPARGQHPQPLCRMRPVTSPGYLQRGTLELPAGDSRGEPAASFLGTESQHAAGK